MLDLRIERDKDSQIEKATNLIKCVKFLLWHVCGIWHVLSVWDFKLVVRSTQTWKFDHFKGS